MRLIGQFRFLDSGPPSGDTSTLSRGLPPKNRNSFGFRQGKIIEKSVCGKLASLTPAHFYNSRIGRRRKPFPPCTTPVNRYDIANICTVRNK